MVNKDMNGFPVKKCSAFQFFKKRVSPGCGCCFCFVPEPFVKAVLSVSVVKVSSAGPAEIQICWGLGGVGGDADGNGEGGALRGVALEGGGWADTAFKWV